MATHNKNDHDEDKNKEKDGENNSDDDYDSDEYYTDDDDDDDDSMDPIKIWGEDPDWVKNNKKRQGNANEEDDDDDEDAKSEFKASAHHIIILIDTRPTMFEKCIIVNNDNNKEEESTITSPFELTLQICKKIIHERINNVSIYKKGSKRDCIGINLYGTKRIYKDNNKRKAINIHEIINLQPPTINSLLEIMKCKKKRNLQEEFMDTTTSNEEVKKYYDSIYPDVLRDTNKLFRNCKQILNRRTIATSDKDRFDTKTILIFTNDDHPCLEDDEDSKKRLLLSMSDIFDGDAIIKLFPFPKIINKDNKKLVLFDCNKFYKYVTNSNFEIISTSETSETKLINNISNVIKIDVNNIMNHVSYNWNKPRRAFFLPMLLPGWNHNYINDNNKDNDNNGNDNNNMIMIDFYRIVTPMKRPIPLIIDNKTNKRAMRETQKYCNDSGELLSKKDYKERLRTYVTLGSDEERMPFKYDDMQIIKKLSNANPDHNCLIILGFKSSSFYSITNITSGNINNNCGILERSYLIYPNDAKIIGSIKAFTSLRASMIQKNVMAIGELLIRVTTTSRLVLILPVIDDKIDDKSNVALPPGLLVIPLPYKNEIRRQQPQITTNTTTSTTKTEETASKYQINLMKKIIQKQSSSQDKKDWGIDYKNPSLYNFFNFIESIALNKSSSEKEQQKNETIIDYDELKHKCIGLDDVIKEFCNSLLLSSSVENDNNADDVTSSVTVPMKAEEV